MAEQMTACRRRFVAAACAIAAGMQVALAANDPRGLDLRDEDGGRPSPLTLVPDAAALPPAGGPPFSGNPLWGIALDTLRATRERPLFTPSRRPPAPAAVAPPAAPIKVAAPPPPEPDRPALELLGVVTGAGDGYAVFISTTSHAIISLRTGEGHDGWVLRSVNGREAVLEKNHRTAVVALPQPTADKK
jgi:general secretion pathway protein N